MLENFSEIKVELPVDQIIRQIRELITSGQISSGDKLPPERKLAEKLGVSRTHVRDAIKKLEFYGILKILPQSGTIVAGMGLTALEGLTIDMLKLEKADFISLIETRVLLENHCARLAAERRTKEDIVEIKKALVLYKKKVRQGLPTIEEDLMFHLRIAEASKNTALKSLMLIITPNLVSSFIKYKVCNDGTNEKVILEHQLILQSIIDGNGDKAFDAMNKHLEDILEYSNTTKP